MKSHGRTLKIFVMGNDSQSLKRVELVNWTGVAFIGNRTHLSQIKNRRELSDPGVYLLLSDNSERGVGLSDIYIGETDNFTDRLTDHIRQKDWWEYFVVFISRDQNLTKAHVKFLERELFLLSQKSISTLHIMNTVEPGGSKLPESDINSMWEFLDNMRFLLETLGLSYFPAEKGALPTNTGISNSVDTLDFYLSLQSSVETPDAQAPRSFMTVRNSVYVLKAGSYIQKTARESFERHDSYYALWLQISESEAVMNASESHLLKTVRDIEFRSPSAAAAVVKGRSVNGRTAWRRVGDGRTFADCEAELSSSSD